MSINDQLRSVIPDVRVPSGVVVVAQSPELNVLTRSLHPGDIIHALNRTPTGSVEQPRSALHRLRPGDPVVLQIERQSKLQYVVFDME